MALIQEKEFQKITIHEIAEREDINRGTFYLHFADKYEMMDRFEEEMIEKVERAIVENLPEQRSKERFIEKRYDTIAQILACFEKNKDLLQFLLKANYSSFQAKFRNKIKRIASEMALPAIGKLRYEISDDLFAFIFTSILLSLAEYAFQSKTSIDIKRSAELIFNIVLHGPAKTLGLLENKPSESYSLLTSWSKLSKAANEATATQKSKTEVLNGLPSIILN